MFKDTFSLSKPYIMFDHKQNGSSFIRQFLYEYMDDIDCLYYLGNNEIKMKYHTEPMEPLKQNCHYINGKSKDLRIFIEYMASQIKNNCKKNKSFKSVIIITVNIDPLYFIGSPLKTFITFNKKLNTTVIYIPFYFFYISPNLQSNFDYILIRKVRPKFIKTIYNIYIDDSLSLVDLTNKLNKLQDNQIIVYNRLIIRKKYNIYDLNIDIDPYEDITDDDFVNYIIINV
jgi:hypothetical protein